MEALHLKSLITVLVQSVSVISVHISHAFQFTPDEKFLCMVDTGLDNIKAYRFDHSNGHLTLADIIHCELNSAPLRMLFSKDDRHMYMISELKKLCNSL